MNDIRDNVLPNNPLNEITPELFIMGGLENTDSMLYKTLSSFLNSVSINNIHDFLYMKVQDSSIIGLRYNRDIDISSDLRQLFLKANDEKENTNSEFITSDHVLMAILNQDNTAYYNKYSKIYIQNGVDYNLIKEYSYKTHEILSNIDKISNNFKEDEDIDDTNNVEVKVIIPDNTFKDIELGQVINNVNGKKVKVQTGNEIKYCQNLNKEVKKGNINKLVGREDILNRITRVIHRKNSNNVLLVGDEGVGKTAIVEGLAYSIVHKECLPIMNNRIIYRLNALEMFAGTTLRGQFEGRLNEIINLLSGINGVILFIDDLNNIIGEKHKESDDFSDAISNLLMNKSFPIIATTTLKGCKSLFDNNSDIKNRFQRIDVNEPSIEECVNILTKSKRLYENFHNIKYDNDTLETIVKLCSRYITERKLPLTAFDILDEAGVNKRISVENSKEIIDTEIKLKNLELDKNNFAKKDNFDEVNRINENINQVKLELADLKSKINEENKKTVTVDDIYTTISEYTNIPVSKLTLNDKKNILGINNELKKYIIGQDEAINTVSNVIKRNKVGLSTKNCVLFFVGKSGVGKTLLAKTLAKQVFGDEKYLVRFDMSEYVDETSVNKLIGSSAGYVGYYNGGLLTEAIKNKKHCVLLIDEIEKAHDKVFNMFLQVFDEGFLTDNMGNKVDFKNTIIILTSNVGTKEAYGKKSLGFNEDTSNTHKDIILKEMKNKFQPEFLNRIDDIIYFNELTEDNLKKIIILQMDNLCNRVKENGYNLIYDNSIIDYLFQIVKKDKEYGARPINRVIQNEIENKITDKILECENNINNFTIIVNNDQIEIN